MQLAGDSAALALYAVHYCGNGEISGKIIPAVLTWGIKRYSGYEYPCILFIKHNLNIKKGNMKKKAICLCTNWAAESSQRDLTASRPLFYIWKCAQTAPQMLMAAFLPVSAETTACVRGGRACTLQSKHVIFATAHWHSLQQHDNAAEMPKIYSGCIVAFIQQTRVWTK